MTDGILAGLCITWLFAAIVCIAVILRGREPKGCTYCTGFNPKHCPECGP